MEEDKGSKLQLYSFYFKAGGLSKKRDDGMYLTIIHPSGGE